MLPTCCIMNIHRNLIAIKVHFSITKATFCFDIIVKPPIILMVLGTLQLQSVNLLESGMGLETELVAPSSIRQILLGKPPTVRCLTFRDSFIQCLRKKHHHTPWFPQLYPNTDHCHSSEIYTHVKHMWGSILFLNDLPMEQQANFGPPPYWNPTPSG